MQNTRCPTCDRETVPGDAACTNCGHAAGNGAAAEPPPEVARWVIEPVPPEVREYFLRTFDEAEYWAALRETEEAGGANIGDLVTELERKVHGGP